jgi:hypothetical protein
MSISSVKNNLVNVFFITILFAIGLTLNYADESSTAAESTTHSISFSKDIKPIFDRHCLPCHNSQSFFLGGLRVNSLEMIKKGGDSGAVLSPGNPKSSRLLIYLKNNRMPPPGNPRLNADQIHLIETWIQQGAGS